MEAEIDFCDVFSNLFFERVSGSHFCCFWRLRTSKFMLSPRREHDFHKIDVFEKYRKNVDFGSIFGGQNVEKSRNNGVEKRVCFEYLILCVCLRILAISARFWEAPGAPKIAKNHKKRFRAVFGARLGFGCDFRNDVGAILEDFEWIPGVFWKDFNGLLGGFWDTNDN